MRTFSLLFLTLISSLIFGQKEAYSFVYGNCEPTMNNCEGTNGTAVIRFNNDSIVSIDRLSFHSSFQVISTCISNKEGRLLMASNQKYVYDSSGVVILDFLANDTIDSLLSYRQSVYFLKLNDETDIYYLLNEKTVRITPPLNNPLMSNRTKSFYLSKIKVNEAGFQILSTDTIFRNDTLLGGGMHACRHANGRDWWIFKGTFNQKKYLRGLLTPNSLNFDLYEGPGPNIFQNSCRNQFSADGTKLFHYITTSFRKMQIYDFDRCAGELSNFREIDFSPFIPYPPSDFNPFVLSPDGSKIYMGRSNPTSVFSYQTIQIDVETENMTIVNDSTFVPCLTPNLKWIISGHQTTPPLQIDKLSVITQPNEDGISCNLIEGLYNLPIDGFNLEPIEFANHLLGPIDNTSCDTLGLNQDYTWLPKVKEVSFVIYPNPSSNMLNIKTNLKGTLKLSILDITGKLVFCKTESKNSFILENEIKHLSSGLYSVTIQNGFNMLSAKWVKEQE